MSKEWCNLVFEGRNKDYGAYRIRKNAGRRNFAALLFVIGGVVTAVLLIVGFRLLFIHQVKKAIADLEEAVPQLKMAEVKSGHELKMVAGGRQRRRMAKVEKGISVVPEFSDVAKEDIRFGVEIDEKEDGSLLMVENDVFVNIDTPDSVDETLPDDLPYEGRRLQAVEVVEQMPRFPGGIPALMKWLDENVVYPQNCIRMKIGGEMQVTFLVDIDGKVHEPSVTFSLHPDLDRAVINAIRRMPRWEPGKVDGKLSVVSITLPVHFQPR